MRKIRWKSVKYKGCYVIQRSIEANIDGIVLKCRHCISRCGTHIWYATVFIDNISHSGRIGPDRHSLPETKKDAIRLAKEMLIDYHTAVIKEMKNFGVEI